MKQSPSFKKVQDLRDALNQGKTKILAKDLSSVVYLYMNSKNQFCAVGYRGRAKKQSFNYRYPTYDNRAKIITGWMTDQSKHFNKKRTTEQRNLSVGDVLKSSWGYDQTNIDYFLITKLIGKTMVELHEIGSKSIPTLRDQGDSIPDIESFIGESMRRVARGESVTIDDCRYARKKHTKTVAGVEVFTPDSWTAYY